MPDGASVCFALKLFCGEPGADFLLERQTPHPRILHPADDHAIDALGWTLDRITDEIQPKLATVTISSEFLAVDPGYVCGVIQEGAGYRKGQPVIRLHFEAYLGAPESFDSIEIEGSPPLSMKLPGGIHGDVATVALVVNSIPKVLEAAPGLQTMRDLALPSFFPGK